MNSKSQFDETLFLERVKNVAMLQLEEAVSKHLKNQFYNKLLPKLIKEIKNEVLIDLAKNHDGLELSLKIKGENENE